jgi:uncharacterized protein (DUF885 family)
MMRIRHVLAIGLLWSSTTLAAAADPDASAALAALTRDYDAHALQRDVYGQVSLGQAAGALPVRDRADLEREVAYADGVRAKLSAVPVAGLTTEERLTAAVLRWQLDDTATALAGDAFVFPGPYGMSELNFVGTALAANPLQTKADEAAYLALVGSAGRQLDAMADRLWRQAAKGIFMPQAQVPRALKALAALRDQAAAWAKPARSASPAFAGQAAAETQAVLAALDRVSGVLGPDYLARGPVNSGLAQYPGGKAYYRQLVKSYTTMETTPEALAAIGREGLKRNSRELASLADRLGITGGHAGLKHFVETDPGFFVKTPEALAARYQHCMDRIAPLLPAWFDPLPKAPYHTRRLDPALEPGMTYGYYEQPISDRPEGEYRFNGSNLDKRSQFNACGLIFHELMPGHHLQVASQLENTALPSFRRTLNIGAYAEGWAEYASNLARDMNAYPDDRDLLGRLMMNAQIYSRLVVDVGLNYDGWTLAEAAKFLRENTFISEPEIESDLFRYGTDIPGQALSYGAGAVEIAAIRRDAEKQAGKDFDIRRFHREVIGHGPLPMAVLRAHVLGERAPVIAREVPPTLRPTMVENFELHFNVLPSALWADLKRLYVKGEKFSSSGFNVVQIADDPLAYLGGTRISKVGPSGKVEQVIARFTAIDDSKMFLALTASYSDGTECQVTYAVRPSGTGADFQLIVHAAQDLPSAPGEVPTPAQMAARVRALVALQDKDLKVYWEGERARLEASQ